MLKLLITGVIIYFLYKSFFGAPLLKNGNRSFIREQPKKGSKPTDDDSEYIDYEEVED